MDDRAVAGELEAIAARLQALTLDAPSPTLGPELGAIRADLRRLALENDEVRRRLGEELGLTSPSGPTARA